MQTEQQILLVKQVEIRYFQSLIFPATFWNKEPTYSISSPFHFDHFSLSKSLTIKTFSCLQMQLSINVSLIIKLVGSHKAVGYLLGYKYAHFWI